MNLVKKATQKVGEGVGVYAKTEESEDFKRQEKYFNANSDATDKLVKELTPDSASGATAYLKDKMGKENLGKTQETKRGELFISMGNELKSSATHESVLGDSLISLGESLRQIGEVHQSHDALIIESSVGPLRIFNDNVIKDIHRLEKNYRDKRLDYDAALRAHKSKGDSKTQATLDTRTKLYEDARNSFLEKVSSLPSEESAQVGYLASFCKAQAEYYASITSMYEEASQKLSTLKNNAPSYTFTKTTTSYASEPISPRGVSGGASVGVRPAPPPPGRPASVPLCRGLYDFSAAAPTEVSFKKGDCMSIRKQVNADWIEVELNGNVGLVPSNYVEML